MYIEDFYVISATAMKVKINITGPAKPILWINGGLYGLLSKGKVQNELIAQKHKRYYELLSFWWDECTIVPSRVAHILLREQETKQCSKNPANNS